MTHFRDFYSSNQIHCGTNDGDNLIKLRHFTYAKLLSGEKIFSPELLPLVVVLD